MTICQNSSICESFDDEEETLQKIPYDFAFEHKQRCAAFAWLLENAIEVRMPTQDELQNILRLAQDIAGSAEELFREVQKDTRARGIWQDT